MKTGLWLLLICTLAGADPLPPPPTTSIFLQTAGPLQVGQPAPDFAGWTTDDKLLRLSELRAAQGGLVLAFCASWCHHCKTGLSLLESGKSDLLAAGVEVLLIGLGGTRAELVAYRTEVGTSRSLLHDKFGAVAEKYGLVGGKDAALPLYVLIDTSGMVRGLVSQAGGDLVSRLLALLVAPSPVPTGGPVP